MRDDDGVRRAVEEIIAVTFRCTPLILTEEDRKQNHDIREVIVTIYAKTLDEAEIILYNRTKHFFDQNLNVVTSSMMKGYRQVT
jgi:hypothetical protein